MMRTAVKLGLTSAGLVCASFLLAARVDAAEPSFLSAWMVGMSIVSGVFALVIGVAAAIEAAAD